MEITLDTSVAARTRHSTAEKVSVGKSMRRSGRARDSPDPCRREGGSSRVSPAALSFDRSPSPYSAGSDGPTLRTSSIRTVPFPLLPHIRLESPAVESCQAPLAHGPARVQSDPVRGYHAAEHSISLNLDCASAKSRSAGCFTTYRVFRLFLARLVCLHPDKLADIAPPLATPRPTPCRVHSR